MEFMNHILTDLENEYTVGVEKIAGINLDDDTFNWNKQILKHLYEEHDWLDVDNFYMKWNSNFDGKEGYGLGVVVLEREGMSLSIPVVVDSYELKPLDIYFDVQLSELKPLTPHNVEKSLFGTDITDELVDKEPTGQKLYKDVFAPNRGRRSVYASVLDEIDIFEDDMADFSVRVKQEDGNEVFNKIAELILKKETFSNEEPKEKIAGVLILSEPEQGYEINWYQDGYRTKTASYYDTYQFLTKELELTKEAVDKKLEIADQGKPVALHHKKFIKTASTLEGEDVDRIEESGKVKVLAAGNEFVEAFGIPKVLSLRNGEINRESMLINNKRNIISYGGPLIGKRERSATSMDDISKIRIAHSPTQNDTISFIWRDTRFGDYVALEPGSIMNYQQISGVGDLYSILSPFGILHQVLLMKNVVKADFSRDNKYEAIVLPEDAVLALRKGMSKNLVQEREKVARAFLSNKNKIIARYFKETDQFELMNKTASPKEALTTLVNEGISIHNAQQFLQKTAQKRESEMYVEYPPRKEKQAEVEQTIEFDTVKLANEIKDVDTLDKVLALNFVNNKNLATFYKQLPEYKETVQKLAALLLTSRLGKIGIDEEVIKDAMNSLQNLVEEMEGYKFQEA